MSGSASVDESNSEIHPDELDYVVTHTPVNYHKGVTQIVAGSFEGQQVACLLWTESLARKAAQGHLLKSRLERAKRVF